MSLHSFVKAVAALHFENCFNPYFDHCQVHDRDGAPSQRAATLSAILDRALSVQIDAIWIGRDLGYRGGRRTGLALTDDVHIGHQAHRWGVPIERPTTGVPVKERTAAIIWTMLDQIEAGVFLWNVFPLHPHERDNQFSNRQHNARERRAGEELLDVLIQMLRPARIVAIGNDAAGAAKRVAERSPVVCVRHPSYGGQSKFVRQICDLYSIEPAAPGLL